MLTRIAFRKQVLVLATALIALLAGCSAKSDGASTKGPSLPIPTITSGVRNQRGTVVSSEEVPNLSPPLTASNASRFKVVYQSVSGVDGTERDISGTVFVPPGQPPAGGWPVIAYGHGTTGITNDCGPSGYPDLLGYDLVVASLVDLGFVVSLTDYEGLGHPGAHPFLEPRTAAFNMIDSVRAARNLIPTASTRWFAIGVSQGGQASWAANEFAGEYGDGLQFLGSISQSPDADLANIPELAAAGWLTRAQQVLLPMLIHGLQVTHPNLNPDDYLHGPLAENRDMWFACSGPLVAQSNTVVLGVADSKPGSTKATDAFRQALRDFALPQRPATGPMLVITGGADDVVRAQWVTSAVKKACEQGDTVELIVRPDETQSNLNAGPRISAWLSERLAGSTPVDTCKS
jgi:hypothetical protein